MLPSHHCMIGEESETGREMFTRGLSKEDDLVSYPPILQWLLVKYGIDEGRLCRLSQHNVLKSEPKSFRLSGLLDPSYHLRTDYMLKSSDQDWRIL